MRSRASNPRHSPTRDRYQVLKQAAGEAVEAEGQQVEKGQRPPTAYYNVVGADYFKTMQIAVIRGRAFTEQDNAQSPRVAIINEFMANRFWPGQDPIGKRFRQITPNAPWMDVVGVTPDGKVPLHLRRSRHGTNS